MRVPSSRGSTTRGTHASMMMSLLHRGAAAPEAEALDERNVSEAASAWMHSLMPNDETFGGPSVITQSIAALRSFSP